nr:MAG TPA: hypothetical protein [Caudoviricetes sp.]
MLLGIKPKRINIEELREFFFPLTMRWETSLCFYNNSKGETLCTNLT